MIVCLNEGAPNSASEAGQGDESAQRDIEPVSRTVARHIVSDPVALFTVVLALFTWRLIVVGRYQHGAAMEALRLSRDEFEANHRPWLAIRDVRICAPVMITHDAAIIPIEFKIENTGTTPAVDFIMFGEGKSMAKLNDIWGILDQLGRSFSAYKNAGGAREIPSSIIFPQETRTHRTEFGVPLESFPAAPNDPAKVLFTPLLIGAFFYRSTFDKTDRRTTFAYTASFQKNWMPLIPEGQWREFPEEGASMARHHIGWTAS